MTQQSIDNGLVSGERYLSLPALDNNARRAASALHAAGVWQGDMVALLLRNDFAFFEATQGAALLGATCVPMNWHMSVEEIAYVLDDSGAKVLIAHSDLLNEAILSLCTGREVVAVPTPPEIAAAINLAPAQCSAPGVVPEWYHWLSGHSPWRDEPRTQPNAMFYTSGTTGMPKGVVRKPVAPEVARRAASRSADAWGTGSHPVRAVMTGPLYHSAPNAYGMGVIRNGGLLVLQPRFDAEGLLALIDQWSISHLHMVPTMFVRLLKLSVEQRQAYQLHSLRHVSHGAAPCPKALKQQMIEWWGPIIHEYYAMTETGIVAMCNSDEWLAHPGTVGRPAEGIDIRILSDTGSPCEAYAPGQICVRSETTPYVAYHRAADKTADLHLGNFIATGDVGYVDEDGFLYISDRISDMVISGGANIYPAEIEKVLQTLDGVRDCAVFGVPDEEFGERLVCLVSSVEDLNGETVTAYLRSHLSGYKVPREILFHRELPREDSGKIKKRLLRDAYLASRSS